MKKPSRRQSAAATPPTPAPSRLSGVRPLVHDEDERQSGQDLDYGQTIFTRGTVPLPRFLTGRKKK